MKKRGMSTVIATLIVIVITLVAVAILWVVIRALIQRNSEGLTLSKFTIDLKIESVRITNDTINVKVRRNPGDGNLKGITFIIFDGENSHIIEKTNDTLEPLERKTFILEYTGPITKVSIAPMFETTSGKLMTGSITDIYYLTGYGGGTGGTGNESNCTPDCGTRECGPVPNGCGVSCGACPPEASSCNNGVCTAPPEGCNPDCSCSATTCIGQFCGDCGNCSGQLTLEQDCMTTECGESPNGCGDCGSCEYGILCDAGLCCGEGYHNDGGICVVSCVPDCGTRECGPVPNGCGMSCGVCDSGAGEWCDNGYCATTPCTPDCESRNCGPVPNGCGDNCGICNATLGEYCTTGGICSSETYLNNGTVYSVWPINIGIYFDSENLPKSGVDYTNYYAKFTTGSETRCLQIREFIVPVVPAIYNMSHIRFVTSSTEVQPGDKYQIWETYAACTH